MKKLFRLLFMLQTFSLCNLAIAQNGPAESWRQRMGGSGEEKAIFVLECSDGGFLLLGESPSTDSDVTGNHGRGDAWIVKRNANGSMAWQTSHGTKYADIAYQAVEVNDGYIVAGRKDGNWWVFKINKQGSLLWERITNTGYYSNAFAIRKLSNGQIAVGGNSGSGAMFALYDLNGNQTYSVGLLGSSIREIRQTTDGNLLLIGNYDRLTEPGCWGGEVPAISDVWICKFLLNAKDKLWDRTYGGTTYDVFVDAEVNAADHIYLIGRTHCKGQITGPNNIGGSRPDAPFNWLAHIDQNGNLRQVIQASSDPRLFDVFWQLECVTVDCKGLPVVGGAHGGFLGSGPLLEKFSSDLSNLIWSAELDLRTDYHDVLYDVRFTSTNAYIACGGSYYLNENYLLLKTENDPDCTGSGNKCQNVTPIYCGQTINSSTTGRTSQFGINDFNSCYNSSSAFNAGDQVFEFYKPNNSGDLVITLFSNGIDHDLFLLSNCNPIQCIGTSHHSIGGPSGTTSLNEEIIRIPNASAGYYYIVVDGYNASQTGPFSLTVNCGILDCVNAKPIGCKETLVNESTSSGFNYTSIYCNPVLEFNPTGGGCTGKEKVYTFLLNSPQTVTIRLTNIRDPNDDFEMFLFKDCNEDVCIDQSTNPKGQNETISRNLTAGRYYLVVDGWRESEGNFDISVDWNCCTNPVEVYNCGYVTYQYAGNGSDLRYTFSSNKSIASGKKWKVGNSEISTATGNTFTYTFPSPGEYLICFPYLNANNCLEYCCYKVWIANPFECFLFDYRFNPTSNNYSFTLDLPGATNIIWKDDTGGGDIGGGPISNPVPAPPGGGCVEKTITVSYYFNGRWYLCCRKIWICNPFDCLAFDYRYDLNANGMVFQLNAPNASYVTWKDDTGGGDIGGGPISNPLPVPPNPGDCIERIISVKYFANGRWYLCCRRVWICNPFDCGNIVFRYNGGNNAYQFELTQNGASQIIWKDDTSGGGLGGGPVSGPVAPPTSGPCVEKIITARYFFNGRWYICCKRFWLCNPNVCASEIQARADANGQVILSIAQAYANVVWINQNTGQVLGQGNSIQINFPSGSDQEVCAQFTLNGQTRMCCKSFRVVANENVSDQTKLCTIHPNPNQGHFIIQIHDDQVVVENIRMFNLQGCEQTFVSLLVPGQRAYEITTRTIPSGIYILRIQTSGGLVFRTIEIL